MPAAPTTQNLIQFPLVGGAAGLHRPRPRCRLAAAATRVTEPARWIRELLRMAADRRSAPTQMELGLADQWVADAERRARDGLEQAEGDARIVDAFLAHASGSGVDAARNAAGRILDRLTAAGGALCILALCAACPTEPAPGDNDDLRQPAMRRAVRVRRI